VTLSTTSGLSSQARAEVRSLLDVPLLAHIAARRTTDVDAAAPTTSGSLALLQQLAAQGKVLRVAADAADPAASAAARSMVDILNNAGVPAKDGGRRTSALSQARGFRRARSTWSCTGEPNRAGKRR